MPNTIDFLDWSDLKWYLVMRDRADRLLRFHPKHPTGCPVNRVARYME